MAAESISRFLARYVRYFYVWITQSPPGNRWLTRHFRKWFPDEEIVVNTLRGFAMAASPRGYTTHRIYFFGEYEHDMSDFITYHVFEGQTAWDIGSERGWFSLLLGRMVGPTGRVDAFEAFPPHAEKVRRNIQLNKMSWVNVNAVAVSDKSGHLWFRPPGPWYPHESNHSGVGHLTDQYLPGAIKVPTISLDNYAEETGVKHLSFIKLDIEGAEVAALKGAERVVRRCRPVLAIEYSDAAAQRTQSSIEELDNLLESYEYDRYLFNGRYVRFDLSQLRQDGLEADFNVYCFPRKVES